MKDFFEWGFKIIMIGAATLLIKNLSNISETIQALDVKFGIAIVKLEAQANFVQATVQDHETRIRVMEQKNPK